MLRNKVVWDKHYYSNRITVRNIFLLRYSRFRLMCTFKVDNRQTDQQTGQKQYAPDHSIRGT